MITLEITDRQIKLIDVETAQELYPRGPLAGALVQATVIYQPGQPAQVNLVVDVESISVNSHSVSLFKDNNQPNANKQQPQESAPNYDVKTVERGSPDDPEMQQESLRARPFRSNVMGGTLGDDGKN